MTSAPDKPTRLRDARAMALRGWRDQRRRDALGWRIHLVLALVCAFFLAWPTTFVELAPILLAGVFLVRMTGQWRVLGSLFCSRAMRAWYIVILAWVGWVALSLLWTRDAGEGLDHLGSMRWFSLALLLWPVLDARGWILLTLLAAFALGQVTQLGQAIGLALDIEWLTWDRMPGRVSGWWDPVVGGTLLVGVLGVHLGALWSARTRAHALVFLCGACAGALGAIATGSRGAWLAAGVLVIGFALAWIAREWRSGRRGGALALTGLGVVALVTGVGVIAISEGLTARAVAAKDEVRRAIVDRDYDSHTGARIQMGIWAFEAWRERPIHGLGAGGYREWTREQGALENKPAGRGHAHAHNVYLHEAATLGLVGLALALAVWHRAASIGLATRGVRWNLPNRKGLRGLADALDDSPACGVGLVGLALVGMFDAVTLNSQTMALFALLVALSPPVMRRRAQASTRLGGR